MLNDFSDYFDSDDDAILLEASNCELQNDLKSPNFDLGSRERKSYSEKENTCATSSELNSQVFLLELSRNVVDRHEQCVPNSGKLIKENEINISFSNSSPNVIQKGAKNTSTPDSTSNVSNCFITNVTPNTKKRKFFEPEEFFEKVDEAKEICSTPCKLNKSVSVDSNIQSTENLHIPEHLSLSSWHRLQAEVSSCSSLTPRDKQFTIKQVLLESSKKFLPKHMVVPILCVLLKKIIAEGSSITCVFMDNTGEINGKIDGEILSQFKEFMMEGTALILKNVTFLCNVLTLKIENVVSLYLPNGVTKHFDSLAKAFGEPELLKSVQCKCLKSTHQTFIEGISHKCNSESTPKRKIANRMLLVNNNQVQNKPENLIMLNSNFNIPKSFTNVENKSDSFIENSLNDEDDIDEFDKLLGNLDENSFLGDL